MVEGCWFVQLFCKISYFHFLDIFGMTLACNYMVASMQKLEQTMCLDVLFFLNLWLDLIISPTTSLFFFLFLVIPCAEIMSLNMLYIFAVWGFWVALFYTTILLACGTDHETVHDGPGAYQPVNLWSTTCTLTHLLLPNESHSANGLFIGTNQ